MYNKSKILSIREPSPMCIMDSQCLYSSQSCVIWLSHHYLPSLSSSQHFYAWQIWMLTWQVLSCIIIGQKSVSLFSYWRIRSSAWMSGILVCLINGQVFVEWQVNLFWWDFIFALIWFLFALDVLQILSNSIVVSKPMEHWWSRFVF